MAVISERFDRLGRLSGGASEGKRYRLGIMGGTFDPIHIGHLACAEQARVAFGLDVVVFVPTGNPAFKQGQEVTPAIDRLRMCRLACLGNAAFDVSSLETDREGVTYTIDTLRAFREHYPGNVELYFITGADAMFSILKWRDPEEIARLAHLIAVTRPGYEFSNEIKEFFAISTGFDISYLEMTALSISSSMLREWVAEGKSIRYLTPSSVWAYIKEKRLYRSASGDAPA